MNRLAIAAVAAAGLLAIVSSPAPTATSGVLSGFALTPASTAAGSDPSITTTIDFHYSAAGDSVRNITSTLPPGMLAAPANVPQSCSTSQLAAMNCPAGSLIGSGTVTTSPDIGAVTTKLYLTPASGSEAAGIGAIIYYDVTGSEIAVGTGAGALGLAVVHGTPVGELRVSNLPNSVNGVPIQIQSLRLTINGKTSAGTAFTRLPTSCGPATTTVSVDTYSAGADGAGSDTFTPTGCSSISYTPTLSATAVKDSGDSGVAVTTVISQPEALTQAAGAATTLSVPTSLVTPNPGLLLLACGNTDPATCPSSSTVGAVTARTPLLTGPLKGRIVVVNTPTGLPGLTIILTTPITVELPGTISFSKTAALTTFAGLPDIPLTELTVALSGGNGAAFRTTCASNRGFIGGSFTGQNGARSTAAAPVTVVGCKTPPQPGARPRISAASLTGIVEGAPRLSFKLSAGSKAPRLRALSFSLPPGLVLHPKELANGLRLSGGKRAAVTLRGGRLDVSLRAATGGLSVILSGRALTATSRLSRSVKAHRLRSIMFRVKVTDASGKSTQLSVTISKLG